LSKTITDANFVSTASTAHQSYLDVIPSVIINWNFDASSGINLGFTQRIKRPGINQLNPFIDRSNPDFQSSGNPALQRVLFNSAQLDYHLSKKTAVNIGVDYNSIKGLDLRVSTFNPATNITYTTSQNTGQVTALGTFINISYPITKQWNFSLNGNIRYYWLSGPVNGVQQNVDFFLGNAAFSTGYTLDKGWRLNVNVDINSRNPTGLQGSS
jgi:ferric enterobactin receptor